GTDQAGTRAAERTRPAHRAANRGRRARRGSRREQGRLVTDSSRSRLTPPGTVERDGSIRLFCALRLPEDIVDGLVDWGHGALADDLRERREQLGVYEGERRVWLAHVTVLRFRQRPRLDPSLPDLSAFSPSDAALYHSVLRSTGAQYEVLEAFALGGT